MSIKRYNPGLGSMVEDTEGRWVTFEEYEKKVLGRNNAMLNATINMETAYNNMEIAYKNTIDNTQNTEVINILRTVIILMSSVIFALVMAFVFGK